MSERKTFPVRLDPSLHAALQRWAADDLRSLNGQIEYLLRQALIASGRPVTEASPPSEDPPRL